MSNLENENDARDSEGRLEQASPEEPRANNGKPEPPLNYRPGTERPISVLPDAGSNAPYASGEYQSARRMTTAALVMALVSLVIGGVVLSTAALVVAVLGYRKVAGALALANGEQALWLQVRKSAVIAIVVSLISLTANAVALAIIYPAFIQAMESGNYASVFGDVSPGQAAGSSTSSIWG